MFNQTWKKYLPVITILLKRSLNGDQVLTLNHTDFERASGGRKMKWSFPVLHLINGRIQNSSGKHASIATEMIAELQADEQINQLLRKHEYEFSMSNDFKLLIKNMSALPATEAVEKEAAVKAMPLDETATEENESSVDEDELSEVETSNLEEEQEHAVSAEEKDL